MGLENLSVGARSALLEVGRMAYGSREGAAGGKGHIGLLNANGVFRVIKFDTHGGSTGGAGAIQSGDALRDLLKTISESAGLPKDTLQEIRKALGLSPNDNPGAGQPKAVFDRTVAAKVVELIGGKEIWREVKATFNKDVYKSRGDTSYDSVINQANGEDTNNAKEIGSIETFTEEALQKHLDDVLNPTLKKIFGDPERKDLVAANNQFSRELKDGVKTIDDMNAKLKKIFADHRWRRSNLDAAMKLLRHTLKGGGTIGSMLANVDLPKTVSRDDLNKAFTNLLVTVAVANRGDVKTSKFLDAIDKTLENVAELDFPGLSPERRLAVSKNAKLLAWCEKIATEYDVANADDLKAAVLRRLFDQDLRNESDDSTEVMEKFAFGDKTVEKTGSKSRLDALKAALGQLKTPKERALENIKKFVTLAAENGNRADFYLKRSEDGKGLTSAGSRNIFRGSTSRDENNDVRAWLKQNLVTYYGSEGQIPGRVRQELTNFEGGGHPLSAERVGQIWDAMVEHVLSMPFEEYKNNPEVTSFLADNGKSLVIPDALRTYLMDNHVDLSNEAVSDKLEQERRYVQDARIPLNVGEVLTDLQQKTDISNTKWANDVTSYQSFKIGDQLIEGQKFYAERCAYYKALGDTANAQKKATKDTCDMVADTLAKFVSHDQFSKLDDLLKSDDARTKKLLRFAMSHMTQGMLNVVENPALSDLGFTTDGKAQLMGEMSFDEVGGIVFKQRIVSRFSALCKAFLSKRDFDFEAISCDPQKSRSDKSIMIMYSKKQLDQILEADFDAYAEKYRAVDPQERNNKPGEIEKYGDDDHQLVRGRAKALNDQIDERMHFHPEVKMNYVISAIES